MKKNILVSITTTDCETDRSIFWNLATGMYRNYLSSVYFLMIYQTPKMVDFNPEGIDEIVFTDVFSVSNARNIAIEYAQKNQFDFIIFNDSSVVPNSTFLRAIAAYDDSQMELMKGNILWGNLDSVDLHFEYNYSFYSKKINPLVDAYVGAYLFNVKSIGGLRFNLRLGGGGTVLNCGEDVIFLVAYFKKNNIRQITVINNAYLIHPPRELNYSKHLKYAYGQGVLYRYLLKELNDIYMFKMIFLFFMNALFRALCGRPNAWGILKQRLRGFLDGVCCLKAFS